MPELSDFHKTTFRKTYPSFLPAPIIRKVDRLIAPAGMFWRAIQGLIKGLVQSAIFVALLPLLSVMADPLFNGYFLNGNVISFEQYQRFLQWPQFWVITFLVFGVHVSYSHFFSGLAIHVRDRQREHEFTTLRSIFRKPRLYPVRAQNSQHGAHAKSGDANDGGQS